MTAAAFNPLVQSLTPPAVPSVLAWGRAYEGQRGPKIDMSQAVPGYPAHPMLFEALALHAGNRSSSGYGEIEGERGLREAFAADSAAFYGSPVAAENIHVTAGANQAFVATMLAIASNGDRIGLTVPYYFNEEATLAMLGLILEPIACDASTGFMPSLAAVKTALARGLRAIVLVSPNNPTGAIYPADLLAGILDACREAGAWLVLDETYRDFLPPGLDRTHALLDRPDWQDNLILLYSFSKSYCVPGHRIGAVTGSPLVVEMIARVMDNLQICAPRAAQAALAECMPKLGDWKRENRAEIARRANALARTMESPGLEGYEIVASGAYFAFLRHPHAEAGSARVAERLAREYGVVALPGAYFGPGLEAYLRLALANADSSIIDLLGPRLAAFSLD